MIVFQVVVVHGTFHSYAYRSSKREALAIAKRTVRLTSPVTVSVNLLHLRGLTPRKLVLASLNYGPGSNIIRTPDAENLVTFSKSIWESESAS